MQILGEIPAIHLDPFLLARSQHDSMEGYIVIAYLPEQSAKCYHLLFLRGSHIHECVTLDESRRERADIDVVRTHFVHFVQNGTALIYLFRAGESITGQFLSTIDTEAAIKVTVDTLSKKQIQSLLRSTNAYPALAERNDFSPQLPVIEFKEISSASDELDFELGFRQGGFLLYPQKVSAQTQPLPIIHTRSDNGPVSSPHETATPAETALESADEFAKFLRGFLAESLNENQTRKERSSSHSVRVRKTSITVSRKGMTSKPASILVDAAGESDRRSRPGRLTESLDTGSDRLEGDSDPHSSRVRCIADSSALSVPAHTAEDPEQPTDHLGQSAWPAPHTKDPAPDADQTDIIRHFTRLLRSFRQQAFECFGQKCESVITQSEQKLQILNPDFSIASIDTSTAPLVLDLIEDVIRQAPLLRRTKLRAAALDLVADLYNKQFELLEKHNVIDRVEQVYYRMKK